MLLDLYTGLAMKTPDLIINTETIKSGMLFYFLLFPPETASYSLPHIEK